MAKKTSTKKKWVCIVLTVLFGVLGWFYTYKIDSWKVWLSTLVLVVFSLNGIDSFLLYGFSVWAIVDSLMKKQEFLDKVYGTY